MLSQSQALPHISACHAGLLADNRMPVGSAPRHILWDADKKSQRPTFLVSFTFTVLFFSPQVSRKRRCNHKRWWIIPPASPNPFRAGFSSVGSPDRPSLPGVRPHPTTSAGTCTNLPVTWHCNHLSIRRLSSGNQWQWVRKHLARRPSSIGSASSYSRSSLSIALCQKSAPSFARVHERYS
jgi:hypothetical protein